MEVTEQYEKVVVLSDVHAPYHDKKTYSTMMRFVKDQKPSMVVLIGDVVDMYSVSRFDKDPRRANNLQEEFDVAHRLLRRLREAAGEDARIVYIKGNHEERLVSYLKRHPELYGLRDLTIERQLRLDRLGIEYRDELFHRGVFLFTHGRRYGIYSSRWELEDNGVSGMSGHTHRVSTFMKRNRAGSLSWYHVGHMADVEQVDYNAFPNWQQGVGIVYFNKRRPEFHAEALVINDHKFVYDGKLYTPREVKRLQ